MLERGNVPFFSVIVHIPQFILDLEASYKYKTHHYKAYVLRKGPHSVIIDSREDFRGERADDFSKLNPTQTQFS